MLSKVVIVGTLDTKGEEFKYIRDIIEGEGLETIVIDAGVLGKAYFEPDIDREQVAEAGGDNIKDLVKAADRGKSMEVMSDGAAKIVEDLYDKGKVAGIISLGGSAGTTIGTTAMKKLPVGVPKVMVSTLASGNTRPYVGTKDITMMYSVVDILGVNSLSSEILSNAAFALAGMVKGKKPEPKEKRPLIAATMFGVTTPCVEKAREYLEEHGYEVLVFHATGTGGKAMENLVEEGFISGVLDITTTELCDELVGGVLSAGPDRLEAAGREGVPQVVSTGALDMVNFGPIDTVPQEFKNRNLYKHNPTVTLMRTTVEENKKLAEIIAEKLNKAESKTALFLPLKGVSMIDAVGQPFYGPDEDRMLFETLRKNIDRDKVEFIEKDLHINDEEYALALAKKMIELIEEN
ncbi:MAG: Tm-1-like ATP-binding domain-containing protein [Halanaerobium sp.]